MTQTVSRYMLSMADAVALAPTFVTEELISVSPAQQLAGRAWSFSI